MRRLAGLLAAAGALTLAACASLAPDEAEEAVPDRAPAPAPPPAREPVPARFTVAAVGDIMLGTDYPENRLAADDGAGYLAAATPLLATADITFGNLEGVLLDGGEPEKICSGTCYIFRSPPHYAAHLQAAGFDLVSLANNHARDFGEAGRDSTMRALAAAGIAHSGRIGDVAKITLGDLQVAMIAFAPNPQSHPLLDIEAAAHMVEGLAQVHDVVLVSFHGGAEGVDALHVPIGMEHWLGEDRGDLRAFAHAVIDAGADLVIGHGPHVPRGMEIYGGRLIAYSLGNFATYYGISVAGIKGLAPLLLAELGADGRFLGGRLVSMRQERPEGPRPDPAGEALRLMRRLSEEDFGPSAPGFGPGGTLLPAAP